LKSNKEQQQKKTGTTNLWYGSQECLPLGEGDSQWGLLRYMIHAVIFGQRALKCLKMLLRAGRQWLMPIILATQEAEIKRIAVQSQPWQKVHKTPSQKNSSQKRLVECFK
jgi:hypothetical protein